MKVHRCRSQGCQMVCFQTKNPNLSKFWSVVQWKIFAYLLAIWSILRPLEIFYGHGVCFVVIWYIFTSFGILYQEKSGNPGSQTKKKLQFNGIPSPTLFRRCYKSPRLHCHYTVIFAPRASDQCCCTENILAEKKVGENSRCFRLKYCFYVIQS
jgi:hypothetical protein